MTSTFHYVAFRTFAHATEDPEKVRQALVTATGEKAEVREIFAEGGHKNPIRILETELKGRPAIDRFFKRLAADDATAVPALRRQLEARLDEESVLYFRLAKQQAFLGALRLSSEDDAIQVRAKVAAFPAKREVAAAALDAYLSALAPDASTASEP